CKKNRLQTLFVDTNNQIAKSCSKCRRKRNDQYTQNHLPIQPIIFEDFKLKLVEFKNQNFNTEKFVVSLNEILPCEMQISSKLIATQIIDTIYEITHFKFIYHDNYIHKLNDSVTYRFYCAQLADRQKKSKKIDNIEKQRDYFSAQRFQCNGWINLSINIAKKEARIEITHLYHTEYIDTKTSDTIKSYIQQNLHCTPQLLWDNLGRKTNITRKQLYYWWMELSSKLWKMDEDQVQSVLKLVKNYHNVNIMFNLNDNGITAIALSIDELINLVGTTAVEIGIDATYNTNNLNLELYSILAEVDGMGFPLAYMLLTTTTAIIEKARTSMITMFLEKLNCKGVKPKFILTDKDIAQIHAIKTVWPTSYIQLCYWHLKKAIQKQLATTKTPKYTNYNAKEANLEFSFIDVNFHPRFNNQIEVSTTFCPVQHREHIIKLITKHFHYHPYIPMPNNYYFSEVQIREAAINEMYTYCATNNLHWVWAYLWVGWYNPYKWQIWARCTKKEIPVLKTTMILESHWRLIKRDYLYKFNRPRIDLLVWVIIDHFIPRYNSKLQNLITTNQKISMMASWRSEFKHLWKQYSKKQCSNNTYITNPSQWTCSCPMYLENRFLLCKHLVQSIKPVTSLFFVQVKRQRLPPFWVHPDLTPQNLGLEAVKEDNESNHTDESDNEMNETLDITHSFESTQEEINIIHSESWEEINSRIEQSVQQWVALLKSQEPYKDARFFLAAESAMKGINDMCIKCEKKKNQRTLPRMWKDHDYQTMFYKA
ncbi:23664_t:CDS:2, partial [Gigaspora margarita]